MEVYMYVRVFIGVYARVFLCVDKRSLIKKIIILIRVHMECFLSLRDSVC